MEKTLTIDGQKVTFKTTAATPLRYKTQFRKDFFADLMKMAPLANKKFQDENGEVNYEAFREIDFEMFYNILWAMAKTADSRIPEPIEWLDRFETFPLMEIFSEVQDLITNNLQMTKKK